MATQNIHYTGFASSAENFTEQGLDLNQLLVKSASSTFFIRVEGHSMIKAGIQSGDILIVDRSLSIAHNKIALVRINNELTIKRIILVDEKMFLTTDEEQVKNIEVKDDTEFELWGIVTFVIHHV